MLRVKLLIEYIQTQSNPCVNVDTVALYRQAPGEQAKSKTTRNVEEKRVLWLQKKE